MTNQQNQASFRRIIDEAFNKGNFSILAPLYNPGFVEHQFGLHPTIDGLKKDIQILRNAFPDLTLTIEELVSEGDKVWARMTARGTNRGGFMGPPNGKTFEITVFDICRFENGMIAEHWGVPDRFALLAQLGLLPQKESIAA